MTVARPRPLRRRSHPARQRVLTLSSDQEAEIFFEALRSVHQRYSAMVPETVADRQWALGYEAALKDVSAQINERRVAMLRRLNGG